MPGAIIPAVGEGPIGFTDTNGIFFLIPLSSLAFDSTGTLTASSWPPYTTHKAQVDPFLQRLLSEAAIQKGPVPAAKPALNIAAVTPGSSGVVIKLTIANIIPNTATPSASTADVSITETDTYAKIPLANLAATIGATAGGGTAPGLAFVTGAVTTDLPQAGSYPLAPVNPGDPATAEITKNGGGGNSFELQARTGDADGALITATISDVDTGAKSFTLVLTWTKSASAQAISALAADFAFVAVIAAPSGGYQAPAAGVITLAGGADAVAHPAVAASATVLTGS